MRPAVTIAGLLAANGGGGGGGGTFGDTGSNAQADTLPAPGGDGSGPGGEGSSSGTIDGSPGLEGTSGGGGGAGRIRINSRNGEVSLSGIVSPALDSECVTQGALEL